MYFSELRMRDDISMRRRSVLGNEYAIHRAIWSLFKDSTGERCRDFLYRKNLIGDQLTVYVVSKEKPGNDTRLWDIETKEYTPRIRAGRRLAFALHANPTVMRRDKSGHFRKHDVVMDARCTMLQNGVPSNEIPSTSERIQSAGYEWLHDRGTRAGFNITPGNVIVDGYNEQKFYKPRSNNLITLKSMDFSGVLTITDPVEFTNILYEGIGSGKGFGCGLMLVKPL